MSRNSRRNIKNVRKADEKTLFKDRNITNADILSDPFLFYPPEDIRSKLNYKEHYWSAGDKYFKLAYKYYGSRSDWWVIARFNGKPTDADLSIGDRLVIPFPLDIVKDYMGYYGDY